VRILGEHNRGNYITQYQIKKIPNFWEFEKNLVPPPAPKNSEERVGGTCGEWFKRCVGNCGENNAGRCF
jgi:hypothetical protein